MQPERIVGIAEMLAVDVPRLADDEADDAFEIIEARGEMRGRGDRL